MMLDNFAKDYINLGLRINKLINGFVEHYYGPLKSKNLVEAETRKSPKKLLTDCKSLKNKLKDKGFEERRHKFLEKNLDAIHTILRKLNGEKIPYLELVENLFDFKPKLYKDQFFYDLSLKAESVYKGKGDLSSRIREYVKKRKIPSNILRNQFIRAIEIARKQTIKVFPNLMPSSERVEVVEVKDQSWPMYCWYLGNFFSRIEINVDRIHYWTNLLDCACHEVYPGHHMERLVREQLLYRDKGYFESSILLIYTPEIVISEGMALLAERSLFDRMESSKILLENFCPNPQNEDSIELLSVQCEIREGFRKFESNLAYHKYVNNWTNDELIDYSRSFKVIPDEGIKGLLDFISDEIWAPYIPVYQGERIIIENLGNPPTPELFLKLLTEQTLPSDLA
ncbi:MAG: hypothetical protein ACFFDB_08420 [Promethearchaeota archaeon]